MCFVGNDICAKLAISAIPVPELMAIRGGCAALIASVLVLVFYGAGAFVKLGNRNVIIRSVIEALVGAGMITCFVFLPIATVNAILQVGPFFAMIVGVLLFKESVGWRRWVAALVGFFGVMLVIQPAGSAFNPAAPFVLLVAFGMLLRDLQSRIIGLQAPPFVVSLGTALAGVTVAFLLTPLMQPLGLRGWGPWLWPDPRTLSIAVLSSLFLVSAHCLAFLAFRSGDLSVVAPFRYVYLLWAVIGGAIVFSDYPDTLSLIGMGLVVLAGLYLLHRERLRAREEAKANA